jgi:hypothetical protein
MRAVKQITHLPDGYLYKTIITRVNIFILYLMNIMTWTRYTCFHTASIPSKICTLTRTRIHDCIVEEQLMKQQQERETDADADALQRQYYSYIHERIQSKCSVNATFIYMKDNDDTDTDTDTIHQQLLPSCVTCKIMDTIFTTSHSSSRRTYPTPCCSRSSHTDSDSDEMKVSQ